MPQVIGRFVIWAEDANGHIVKAKADWRGSAAEGIKQVQRECLADHKHVVDIWATPVRNSNRQPA